MRPNSLAYLLVIWLLSGTALMITSYIVPGFKVKNFKGALLAAIAIGFINAILGPFLQTLAFPLTFLTLGLFYFVVNAAILKMAAAILRDFEINSWMSAIFGAVVLTVVSNVLNIVFL